MDRNYTCAYLPRLSEGGYKLGELAILPVMKYLNPRDILRMLFLWFD